MVPKSFSYQASVCCVCLSSFPFFFLNLFSQITHLHSAGVEVTWLCLHWVSRWDQLFVSVLLLVEIFAAWLRRLSLCVLGTGILCDSSSPCSLLCSSHSSSCSLHRFLCCLDWTTSHRFNCTMKLQVHKCLSQKWLRILWWQGEWMYCEWTFDDILKSANWDFPPPLKFCSTVYENYPADFAFASVHPFISPSIHPHSTQELTLWFCSFILHTYTQWVRNRMAVACMMLYFMFWAIETVPSQFLFQPAKLHIFVLAVPLLTPPNGEYGCINQNRGKNNPITLLYYKTVCDKKNVTTGDK